MEIIYSSKFSREYKKLPLKIKLIAEKREIIFRENPFAPQLKSHKLLGKLQEFWSFSIDGNYRIIFEFSKNKDIFYFHSVGDHDIYQ